MKPTLTCFTLIAALAGTSAFAQAAPETSPEAPPARLSPAERFAGADANTDGNVTLEELTAFITAERTKRDADMAQKMIARLDRNGDGQLQAEEFEPRNPADFSSVDANGDGQISEDEFKAFTEAHLRAQGPRGFGGPQFEGREGHGPRFGGPAERGPHARGPHGKGHEGHRGHPSMPQGFVPYITFVPMGAPMMPGSAFPGMGFEGGPQAAPDEAPKAMPDAPEAQ